MYRGCLLCPLYLLVMRNSLFDYEMLFFLPNSFSFTYRYFSPFYLISVVGRMALKIATGFLVFLLSLAFVSSKTEDQNAKLHDRKGLIEDFH